MSSDFEISAADIAAKSDQLNADDLVGGPLVGVITRCSRGSDDQPWQIHLDSWRHPWRPSKGQRRVLVELLGTDPRRWEGRAVRLYRDPDVQWGGKAVGGIRLSGLSGLSAPVTVMVTVRRGAKVPQVVEPLPAPAPRQPKAPTLDAVVSRLTERGLIPEAVDKFGDNMEAWDLAAVIAWARAQPTTGGAA